jgi:hypothetical protein
MNRSLALMSAVLLLALAGLSACDTRRTTSNASGSCPYSNGCTSPGSAATDR